MSDNLWDEWNAGGGPRYPHEKVVQFTFRNFKPDVRANTRALDLGCGGGVHTAFLVREGFPVTGTDVSPVGVENTRQRLAAENLTAELRAEGADQLHAPADTFGLVLCVGVLEAAGPAVAEPAIQKVLPAMAPGGKGLFIFASNEDFRLQGDNHYGLHGYTRAEVDALFDVGFSTVWIDQYITTYEGDRYRQVDWLVTVVK